jgi:catalase-peroxidase
VATLKQSILDSGLSVSQLVTTAWASAATFRGTDLRGGANGARIRLAPQKDWEVNTSSDVASVISTLEGIQSSFGGTVSLADLIVLGGSAAIEKAAKDAGFDVTVPFSSGRGDATQEQTDADAFEVLEPTFDGFRNHLQPGEKRAPETLLLERANFLTLTAPEMTVLIGGLRALGANAGGSSVGVLTDRPGTLTNDFFVNLLSMDTEWATSKDEHVYEGRDRASGEVTWTASAVDLVFGSNSQLRALAEVYASDDAKQRFVDDFAAAWAKVMDLDRFDLD